MSKSLPRVDAETADRILSGRVAPDDAPPGMGEVTRLVAVARTAPSVGEAAPAPEAAVVVPARSPRAGRKAVGAGLVAAVTLGVVGAAAATAAVVRPWQDDSSDVAAARSAEPFPDAADDPGPVAPDEDAPDEDVPDQGTPDSSVPTAPASSVPDTTATTVTTVPAPAAPPGGPDPAGAARFGLCTAFGARTEMPGRSVAAANLSVAAAAAGQTVEEFCLDAGDTGSDTGSGSDVPSEGVTPDHGPTTRPTGPPPAPPGPPAGVEVTPHGPPSSVPVATLPAAASGAKGPSA